jgi:choline dehydrogenase-like flavoprotein
MLMDRRNLIKRIAAALWSRAASFAQSAQTGPDQWEYVVVGSGAGGGTVAARLVELGHTVFVLEAGDDPMKINGNNALYRDTLPADYEVPAFHPNSTENDALKWDFFVRHYANDHQQSLDDKFRPEFDGVLYPRAGTLGGCTAHNALITVYPHNQDWQHIADITGDRSWGPDNMRKYFERLENCHHRPLERFLHALTGLNPTRHGFRGWLHTEKALPLKAVLGDPELSDSLLRSVISAIHNSGDPVGEVLQDFENHLDPNDWSAVDRKETGIRYTPLHTSGHRRVSTRDRLMQVQKRFPDRLHIETNAVATKIRFEGVRAVEVEYRSGRKLYRPHGGAPAQQGEARSIRPTREIILSGGAFNTPQVLMLSGIGPKDELARWNIDPVKTLEGVGKNLQDRYEIGVVHRATKDFSALSDAEFSKDDPRYREWQRAQGIYTSNGTALAVVHTSSAEQPLPDLFCFALIGDFRGYYPGYSRRFKEEHKYVTWAVLKAHTLNHGGEVTLKSTDPLQGPNINFHYFEEGTDKEGRDLDAVVAGIRFVRKLTKGQNFLTEELPGPNIDSDDELRTFVRNNTWGHHASGTCKIGPEAESGVLDGNFRVHGIANLRVVDASIFPKIPGFFIAVPILIAAEKAAEAIHAASKA